VTVVYLFPPPAGITLESASHQEFMGQLAHQDFQVIALWELDAEQVLAFENPALLPFIPLMRGGDTEQIVRRCAERIRQEAGESELEAILSVFAGYVLDTEVVKQILRWEMTIVKESPIIQELLTQERQLGFEEGLEKGQEKGREKGREEGERKATLKGLHQILTIRFDVALGDFDERFEQLDLKSLEQLNEIALTAQTLAEFEEALAEMLSELEAAQDHSDKDEPQEKEA